jgi:hypothetical protein
MSSSSEPRRAPAYVGVSEEAHERAATLEEAIHDAAVQAVQGGHGEARLKVVDIEFTAHNPHITAFRVTVIPGG